MGKKREPGRPIEIKEQTVIASYNVTEKQRDWVKEYAETHGISASDVVRDILKKEMTAKGQS